MTINRDQAWAELVREARDLTRWADLDGPERAVARLRSALADYEAAQEARR